MQSLRRLWIDSRDIVGLDLISGDTAPGAQRVRRRVRRPGDEYLGILLIRQYLQSEFGPKRRTVAARSVKPLSVYQESVLGSIIAI